MPSITRQVLQYFEAIRQPVAAPELARRLNITPGTLHEILGYWVRKGALREVSGQGGVCQTCGIQGHCPFVIDMPLYYELATAAQTEAGAGCCSGSADEQAAAACLRRSER